MVALVAFDRNGKHLQIGDEFKAYPIEAASLSHSKKAQFMTARSLPSQQLSKRSLTARPLSQQQPPPPPGGEQQQALTETQQAEGGAGRRTTQGSGRGSRGGYARRDMAAPEDKS